MADNEKISNGSEVHLVLANGTHAPATVKKVRGGPRQLVDLEAEVEGQPVVITSSPLDPTGKRPDSWHQIEVEAKPEPVKPADAPKA